LKIVEGGGPSFRAFCERVGTSSLDSGRRMAGTTRLELATSAVTVLKAMMTASDTSGLK